MDSFDPERKTTPQRNRCLSGNGNGACIKDRYPFSRLTTVELLSGATFVGRDTVCEWDGNAQLQEAP